MTFARSTVLIFVLIILGSVSWAEVDLIYFKAIPRNEQVILEWKTASEANNYGFYLERNGVRIPGGLIPGAGNSTVEILYSYVDRGVRNEYTYSYNLISVDFDGVEIIENDSAVYATPSEEYSPETEFNLGPIDPNPFEDVTQIYFQCPEPAHVLIEIYNIVGEKVAVLFDRYAEAAYYITSWQAGQLPSGVYFCRMKSGSFEETESLWLIKELNIGQSHDHLPSDFILNQNYPNPFNAETSIKYQIPEGSHVIMKIFNATGQEIRTLVDINLEAGSYTVTWDGRDSHGIEVSAGIYFCTIWASEYTQIKKMVLLR